MNSFKTLGPVTAAVLLATACLGVGSAMAESTALCDDDPGNGSIAKCLSGHLVTHVHEMTLAGAKAKLLASPEVECDVLFLGDTVFALSAPLLIEGNFTYVNCGSNCTVDEVGGPALIEVLKEGHEIGNVEGEWETHFVCFGINCYYNAEGLRGTARGPLLSSEANGAISIIDQLLHKVKGTFCPSTARLDIVTTPLSATYVTN